MEGRNLEESQTRGNKTKINQVRPKSEKCQNNASFKNNEKVQHDIIQKNLDGYILSLSNGELKQKLESCPGNLGDCPLLNDIRKELKRNVSSHGNLVTKTDTRLCKTSRTSVPSHINSEKTSKQTSSENEQNKKRIINNLKTTVSNTSRKVIRSTRAQDLRSQSNRDLLKPKTTNDEKIRTTSPYVTNLPQKKKKGSNTGNTETKTLNRSNIEKTADDKKKQIKAPTEKEISSKLPYKAKSKKEKSSSAGENVGLQRQKTQEVINPKFVRKASTSQAAARTAAGDCGDTITPLKKSQTFFICKGTKNNENNDAAKEKENGEIWNQQNDSLSEENFSDGDLPSPKLKPLTHNDSFCLIVKSSQNWSLKNRSDDEKWLKYGLTYEEKGKKISDKGILKNSNYDLKSVDSLEKVESEKIVRFSDELLRNKKVLKKLVRRKKRVQNFFTPSWQQKNKLFQKYLQILREKSVLLSERSDVPEDLKPFRVPLHLKERYEAEMFGLYPRKGKFAKHTKDSYSY